MDNQVTRVPTPTSVCRFALAHADITPPVGIYHRMWGAATHDQATGIHRPLRANVALFADRQQPARRQLLVALDHCLLDIAEMDEMKQAVAAATGVDRDELLLTFSHTHAAGLLTRDRYDMPGGDLIADYWTSVRGTVCELVGRVLQDQQEVTITYGSGRCDLARNRDYWDAHSQQFVCGFAPENPADDQLLIARVTDHQQRLVATIVNYACHPTTLAWDNTLISPDYPGAMRALVERETDAPCLFLQGASGDLGPLEGYSGDAALADRNGRQLGYAALSQLETLAPPGHDFVYQGPVISGATVGVWKYEPLAETRRQDAGRWQRRRWHCPLPYREELPSRHEVEAERARCAELEAAALAAGDPQAAADHRALLERQTRMLARLKHLPDGPTYPYVMCAWKIGDAVWLGVQGEPYNLLQTAVRARFPGTPIFVLSLCDSWGPSYLPPAATYGQGLYQESIAVTAPGSLEKVIDEAAALLADWLA